MKEEIKYKVEPINEMIQDTSGTSSGRKQRPDNDKDVYNDIIEQEWIQKVNETISKVIEWWWVVIYDINSILQQYLKFIICKLLTSI